MRAPIEYLVIGFGREPFRAQVVPAFVELVELGIVRVLDVVLVVRSTDGSLRIEEIDELEDDQREQFYDLDGEYGGLLSEQDVLGAAVGLAPGETVLIAVWENVWASRFGAAVQSAGGALTTYERLDRAVVDAAIASLAP